MPCEPPAPVAAFRFFCFFALTLRGFLGSAIFMHAHAGVRILWIATLSLDGLGNILCGVTKESRRSMRHGGIQERGPSTAWAGRNARDELQQAARSLPTHHTRAPGGNRALAPYTTCMQLYDLTVVCTEVRPSTRVYSSRSTAVEIPVYHVCKACLAPD